MNKDTQKFTEAYLSIINEDADKQYHGIRRDYYSSKSRYK